MEYGVHVPNIIFTLRGVKRRICEKNDICILKPCEGMMLCYLNGFFSWIWHTFLLFNKPFDGLLCKLGKRIFIIVLLTFSNIDSCRSYET